CAAKPSARPFTVRFCRSKSCGGSFRSMTSMNSSQIDWLCSLLARTAKQEIMPRFRRLAEGDIRLKTSAADLVTDADEQAERTITAELLAHFPGALVVGEEACSADPSKLE